MSYDVSLIEDDRICTVNETCQAGGTQIVGGTNECELNITYNYGEVFGDLVRELNGRKAVDTIEELQAFVDKWPNARPYKSDYWAPTPGNAVAAIKRLLSFATQNPNGTWHIS